MKLKDEQQQKSSFADVVASSQQKNELCCEKDDDTGNKKVDESSLAGLGFWGLAFTILVTSIGTPLISVASMAREVTPVLAVVLCGLGVLLGTEANRLIAATCDILERRDNITGEEVDTTTREHVQRDHKVAEQEHEEYEHSPREEHDKSFSIKFRLTSKKLSGENENIGTVVGIEQERADNKMTPRSAPLDSESKGHSAARVGQAESSSLRKNTTPVKSYADYLERCFQKQPFILRLASCTLFVGYFTLFLVGDIMLVNSLMQIGPSQGTRLGYTLGFLLPQHLFRAFASRSLLNCVTQSLASGVPYLFMVAVAILLFELRSQEKSADRAAIFGFYDAQRELARPEQREGTSSLLRTKTNGSAEQPGTGGSRRDEPIDSPEFLDYWHTWFPGSEHLNCRFLLTVIRLAGLGYYPFSCASLIPTLRLQTVQKQALVRGIAGEADKNRKEDGVLMDCSEGTKNRKKEKNIASTKTKKSSDLEDGGARSLEDAGQATANQDEMVALLFEAQRKNKATSTRSRPISGNGICRASFAAYASVMLLYSVIIFFAYHVFGNGVPDMITEALRTGRTTITATGLFSSSSQGADSEYRSISTHAPLFSSDEDEIVQRVRGDFANVADHDATSASSRWWLRVSSKELNGVVSSSLRRDISPSNLFRGDWPGSKQQGGTEFYAPWSQGYPTVGSRLVSFIVILCLTVVEFLYITNFLDSCEDKWPSFCSLYRRTSSAPSRVGLLGGGDEIKGHELDSSASSTSTASALSPTGVAFRVGFVAVRLICGFTVPYMVEVAGLVSSLSLVFSELLIPLYGFYLVSGDKNYTQEKKKNHLDKISGPSGATGENIKPVPKTQKNKKNEAPIGDACSLTTSILVEDEDLVEDAGFDDGDTSISRARPGFGLRIFHVFMLIFGVFLFIFANIAGLERIRARYAADSRGRGTIEEIASFSH